MSSLKSLLEMRERPIAPLRPIGAIEATFDFNDPRSHEALINAKDAGLAVAAHYARRDRLNWPFLEPVSERAAEVWLRHSMIEALARANEAFADFGLELLLLDGYRSLADQAALWGFFRRRVRSQKPHLSEEEVDVEARRFCWNPARFDREDPHTWPVHMSGGSVDLTVRSREHKDTLFVGGAFDDPSEVSVTRYFEDRLQALGDFELLTSSEQLALLARRLLVHTLEDHGLLNYEEEWWHFDLGTSIWRTSMAHKGKDAAFFYPMVEVAP